MKDFDQQLDNQTSRQVQPRTHEGFVDSSVTQNVNFSYDPPEPSLEHQQISYSTQEQPDFIIETSKSKLLTLEVNVRQDLDQILYEHPEVSWDTVLEAALISCLSHQHSKQHLLKIASQRLTARKKTAVYKRSRTMAQKYI